MKYMLKKKIMMSGIVLVCLMICMIVVGGMGFRGSSDADVG